MSNLRRIYWGCQDSTQYCENIIFSGNHLRNGTCVYSHNISSLTNILRILISKVALYHNLETVLSILEDIVNMMQKVDILAYFWCCQFHPMSCWHRVQGRLELHSNPRLIFSVCPQFTSSCAYIYYVWVSRLKSSGFKPCPSAFTLTTLSCALVDLQAISYAWVDLLNLGSLRGVKNKLVFHFYQDFSDLQDWSFRNICIRSSSEDFAQTWYGIYSGNKCT